ncbi:Metallothionein expression activator [Lithohypha guttulata]|uniref:Metallothionein expression activator n=1 Tax=Lithohypha guttulata TaxID=1690604 RepID=A0AAN7STT1_9EURO|nr:Metallothionein expression activator [Lithohypha guttulata]KAK5081309.1 Metallothionein expression activator [Lithohypha guttulata]
MPTSANSRTSYMFDENTQHYFQPMHHMQDIQQMVPPHDRRLSQPDLRIQTGMRPYTPTHQIQTAHFPLTPAQTPLNHPSRQVKSLQTSPRALQQDETIVSPRPVSMQKSRSLQGIAEHDAMNSFTNDFGAPLLPASETTTIAQEPMKRKAAHSKNAPTSSMNFPSTPLFGESAQDTTDLQNIDQSAYQLSQLPSSPNRPALSPRRISISDLHLDPGISASSIETNISIDDIAQFIVQPDPNINSWRCTFDGCNKDFGRKENIKSHVQTHLGDRQFKCNHCGKCFVRGHDLKRHSKIHTGTKAYACLCGNAFARHDALTRHRQRGMCIGAFEGIVRKEVKRGRPKKHRPEMEDRLDKASRTRSKQQQGSSGPADTYHSSASSCSMSSWGSPPAESMDNLSIRDGPQSPSITYDGAMNLFGLDPQSMDTISHGPTNSAHQGPMLGDMFSYTPPASPGYSTGNKPTPSFRELTPAEMLSFEEHCGSAATALQPMADQVLNHPVLVGREVTTMPRADTYDLPLYSAAHEPAVLTTQSASLPALSHSSSPPPQEPGSTFAYDFPDDMHPLRMSTMSNMSFGLSNLNKTHDSNTNTHTHADADDAQRNEFDSFLDFNDDSQLGLGMNLNLDANDAFFASL